MADDDNETFSKEELRAAGGDRPLPADTSVSLPPRNLVTSRLPESHMLYGVMAEFENPTDLVAAAHRTYAAGYRRINGYSPFPIEELSEVIGYRLNVGGKPYNSWPAFLPITFECTVLCAAFAAVLGMLALNKLPQPYHPVFNAPNFALATRDRFFLVIEANDPNFKHDDVLQFMKSLDAKDVTDVEV